MKKFNSIILTALTACLAAGLAPGAANAAVKKLCLGTPIVWATGISVSPTSGTINIGSTATVTATVAPSNATDKTVLWSTSNSVVATVSGSGTNNATGTVYGQSAGTATITAKTNPSATLDGTQFTATYNVTVQNPFTIHSNLTGICSTNTSKFAYDCCGFDYNSSGYTFEATSCLSASGTAVIYGNARCSNTVGTYAVQGNPTNNNGSGVNCWCQLCTNSGRGTCGNWVFHSTRSSASGCTSLCAGYCVNPLISCNLLEFRLAFCSAS